MRAPVLVLVVALAVMVPAAAIGQVVTTSNVEASTTIPCAIVGLPNSEIEQKTQRLQEQTAETQKARGALSREALCQFSKDGKELLNPVTRLTTLRLKGSSEDLNSYAWEIIHTISSDANLIGKMGDVNKDYYRLVWEGKDLEDKPKAFNLLVHRKNGPELSNRLPGVSETTTRKLYDILISKSAAVQLLSVYTSTPVPDPMLAQLPDFVQKLNVLGFAASQVGTSQFNVPKDAVFFMMNGQGSKQSEHSITYTLLIPTVPFRRAGIDGRDIIITQTTPEGFAEKAVEIAEPFKIREGRRSTCAKDLADADVKALRLLVHPPEAVTKPTVCMLKPGTNRMTSEQVDACAGALKKALAENYQKIALASTCLQEPAGSSDVVLSIDQRYRDLVGSLGQSTTTGEFKLTNSPGTRYSVGLITGVVLGSPSFKNTRVKMDGGKISEDPMPSLVTMAIVNIHPWTYDSARFTPSWEERVRVFGGGVLTPDFGVTGGIGVGIIRGLSANVGGAWTFPNAIRAGETIGSAPNNQNQPFKPSRAFSGFFGLGFAFK